MKKERGISGIISSLILVIIFVSAVSVILYVQNSTFKGISYVASQVDNVPASVVELPGGQIYSNEPVNISYVIFPNGQFEKVNMKIGAQPKYIGSILGGYGWALAVTDQGQVFNISNIQLSGGDSQSIFPWLPSGSLVGGYSYQYGGKVYYYVPGQYDIGSTIPSSFQGYVSSTFTGFDPLMSQGFTYTFPSHYLYGSIYNSSILFPFYNGSALELQFSWTLGRIWETGGYSNCYESGPINGYLDLGYATLPISLVIYTPQQTQVIWMEYHSYPVSFLTPLAFVAAFSPANVMDNPNIGYYTVRVGSITATSQAQTFIGSLNMTIQDTPRGIEILLDGQPLVFNTVTGNGVTEYDTPFIPEHLLHGEAILNLPAGDEAYCGNYVVASNPASLTNGPYAVILLNKLSIANGTQLNGSPGSVFQIGNGGITLVNTNIFCWNTQGTIYFYEVNVTLDSTYPSVVYAEPVNFNGNQYYTGTWSYFSPNEQRVAIYPGMHNYTFYFGTTYSYVALGGHLVSPSLNQGQYYSVSLPLSSGGELYLNLKAY
ncbi:hypothetical protein [Metallosphaera javensis (ex Sakai et al. 2022)]|uniref:hypothetical protein n=1 Tax=Metallosphaera javensis (ex Sakai et al. 2022) TaxID=2775498 RepID=UPI00258F2533|nr:MAG: hypothetical protein MjAS7_2731 [Metallosphaera javensis (ex Sakai et al. 2022)]